ncbi:hypothetical protein J7337_003932 [Fusarium musae]|uniref:Uncharacterized protein n=1 Tax=Fusarium musae TaxID=1042133 RepID=A0A9P8DM27_9HYPO|nr:hypothetical protein J7337_003932 [Fusarium musae]KAG9503971.1 hypothetical protein J7337_003932 [Fusarium musae]
MDDHSATDQSRSPPRKRPKTVRFPGEDCNADSLHMHDTESREVDYCDAIHKECSGMEIDSNHRYIYVVPENRAVVFFQGMNQAAATLDKDYMAKACEMVTFQFDSSRTMRLFSKLLKTHFENYGGVVPRVHAKILVFEIGTFPEAPLLNEWITVYHAHGSDTSAHNHVAALLDVSTDMGIELHLCRPWRNFGFLKGATTPLRDAGYDLSVTLEEVNWLQVPDQFISFLKAMSARAVTGKPLDDANLQFQSNLKIDIAKILVDHGNRFIRY